MATESTEEHRNISCKAVIFSWIPWPIYVYQDLRIFRLYPFIRRPYYLHYENTPDCSDVLGP